MAKKQKKFEEALGELEQIITNLEAGNMTLEESIKRYKEGMDLATECLTVLKKAEQEIFIYEQEGYKKLEGVTK
ncbi:exodeoxyribonuclease VII small subunit [Sporanaerobium hydrogeniformans]|uniref:Exodeoxyribonuclease VII small subunit n=1 Tax=Sporanaerobium hydrogeniformans TaxID=3072179 RepID=A0AC61DHY6_9FIRM|nr:exodeoxyribonuclease VII small subunit [Sporanaerobium hydrogeniformans]PHV72365.1 exodeoxyribonuclease VII small subunit [Sporanaerobium hydrogeniformans]